MIRSFVRPMLITSCIKTPKDRVLITRPSCSHFELEAGSSTANVYLIVLVDHTPGSRLQVSRRVLQLNMKQGLDSPVGF